MVTDLLSYKILRTELREYVIKRVKDPLRRVLVMVANRIPEITKDNTRFKNTHTLIDIFDKFLELQHDDGRKDMFRAAFKIFLMEIEHDVYYRDRFGWFVEELIKAVLRGDFEERTNGQPTAPSWSETGRYGGKYSIIQTIQRREVAI